MTISRLAALVALVLCFVAGYFLAGLWSSDTRYELTPVTLPPGRLRLATRPSCTGSAPPINTIGMLAVAALAALRRPEAGIGRQTAPVLTRKLLRSKAR
jgi:hypothetical protein